MKLADPRCVYGYPTWQLQEELDDDTFKALSKWLYGQTMVLCNGDSKCDRGCGPVVYAWDVGRFLEGLPVID